MSQSGRDQAKSLQPSLAGLAFDGVWTSNLIRAARFAELVIGDATPDMRLRELDFGELEGKRWEECDLATQQALQRFDGFAPPGGESVTEMRDRVLGFVADLTDGDHLVFTHGGVIRLLSRMLGIDRSPRPGELVVLELGAFVVPPLVQNES